MNKIKLSIIVGCLLLGLGGCSINKHIYRDVKEQVHYLDKVKIDKLACFNQILSSNPNELGGVVIAVDMFYDGSIPKSSMNNHNGPLMDHGATIFEYYLTKALPENRGIVLESLPILFTREHNINTKRNEFGFIDPNQLTRYQEYLLKSFHVKSNFSGRVPPQQVKIFKVKGVFTRNDASPYFSDNDSIDGKYKSDRSDTERNGSISYSISDNSKVMGLTVQIVDPIRNTFIDSETFEIRYNSKRNRYRVGGGYKGYGLTTSFSNVETESMDSAQDALIRESALWVVNRMYDNKYLRDLATKYQNGSCGVGK